jgi:hypothetical protein
MCVRGATKAASERNPVPDKRLPSLTPGTPSRTRGKPSRTPGKPSRARGKPSRTRESRPGQGEACPGHGEGVPDTGRASRTRPRGDPHGTFNETVNNNEENNMDTKLAEQADAALAKWAPLAAAADEARPNQPIHVVLGEAIDVAAMLTHYWEPKTETKGNLIPGFSGVAATGNVTLELGTEIRELQLAVAAAHSEYLVLVQTSATAPLDRADFIVAEIRSTLEFVFDDGKQDDADVQLENLRVAFADSSSQDAMALALEGYAALAGKYRDALAKLQGFDIALVDEARPLAAALREQSAAALTRASADIQREALALRNRLLTLLTDRVKRVRRAATYVFRNQPDIVRKLNSAYERKQRFARRRAKEAAEGVEET